VDRLAPFGAFEIVFPPLENTKTQEAEVHLLTGVNGTGKTRILAILAALLGHIDPLMKRLKEESTAQRMVSTTLLYPASTWEATFRLQASNLLSTTQRTGEVLAALGSVPAFAYSGTAYVTDSSVVPMADMPSPDRRSCLSFSRPS